MENRRREVDPGGMGSHRIQATAGVAKPSTSTDPQAGGGWWIDGNWYPPGTAPTDQQRDQYRRCA
jgi:hypothetical protein